MKFVIINAIKLYFFVNSILAMERDCLNLKIETVGDTDQYAMQGEILQNLDWRSNMYNFLFITSRGRALKQDEISNNICKCVISLLTNKVKRYSHLSKVSAAPVNIDVRLENRVIYGIPVIECRNAPAGLPYNPKIMKGTIGGFLFRKVYDFYLLNQTADDDRFQYRCQGVLRYVNMDIFKPLIQMQSFG